MEGQDEIKIEDFFIEEVEHHPILRDIVKDFKVTLLLVVAGMTIAFSEKQFDYEEKYKTIEKTNLRIKIDKRKRRKKDFVT